MILEEIRRRQAVCAAATPGPWVSEIDQYDGHPDPDALRRDVMAGTNDDHRRVAVCEPEHSLDGGYDKMPTPNAAFIAHARTGYPETLAALADAVAALEKYAEAWGAEDGSEAALAWEADGYGGHARAALAQIAGRLGHMDVGREGDQ